MRRWRTKRKAKRSGLDREVDMPCRESAIEDNVNGVLFARGGGSSGSCGCVCGWTVDSAGLMCHAAFFFF